MANTRFVRWFYDVFVDIFKGKIKDAFVSALKQQVTNAISDINQQYTPLLSSLPMFGPWSDWYDRLRYVASFPVKTAVNDVVGINYALVYEPVNPYIASFGAVTNHVGTQVVLNLLSITRVSPVLRAGRFYWLNGTANCPYPSGEMIPGSYTSLAP